MSFNLPLRALSVVSDGQPWQMMTCDTASKADESGPEQLLDSHQSSKRVRSWSSNSDEPVQSTAADDPESESLASSGYAGPLVGRVLSLSRSPDGCRQVQDALERATSDEERELLVREMHGHAVKAMRCPHANHVLQKCISTMPPASLQFMVDELLQGEGLVKQVATHRYGTRIVQQLLKTCAASQVEGLVEALLQDAMALSCHTFGNYTIQHLLQFGTAQQQYLCVRMIEQNMGSIARNQSGVGAVVAAMTYTSPEDGVWIARAAVQDPKLLPCMAQMRHGDDVVALVVSALQGQERAGALRSLADASPELLSSRYGRKVHAYLEARARGSVHAGVRSERC